MRPNVDLQPAGAQDLEIGDRRLGTGKNHKIGVPRQSRIGFDVYQLHGGFCGQGIKVIKIGDAWKDGNSDSDFRVASVSRCAIEAERIFGRQEIRIGKKRDEAERRPTGCPRDGIEPGIEQPGIAAEFIDHEAGDHRRIRRVQHRFRPNQAGDDTAALDIGNDDDRNVGCTGKPHVGDVVAAEVDLRGAARAFDQHKVGIAL